MNIAVKLIVTITLALFHSSAFAEVYHCVGPEGEKTFSYAPCAKPAPVVVLEEPAPVPEVDEEALIDLRISALQDKLEGLRADYIKALESIRGQSTNELTARYDTESSKLLDTLTDLYQQKRQVAAR